MQVLLDISGSCVQEGAQFDLLLELLSVYIELSLKFFLDIELFFQQLLLFLLFNSYPFFFLKSIKHKHLFLVKLIILIFILSYCLAIVLHI